MIFYTYNFGETQELSAEDIPKGGIEAVEHLTAKGVHSFSSLGIPLCFEIPCPPYFELRKASGQWISHSVVAFTDNDRAFYEQQLENFFLAGGFRGVPEHVTPKRCPDGVPWCGIVLLDEYTLLAKPVQQAIDDFNRSMAFAIFDAYRWEA